MSVGRFGFLLCLSMRAQAVQPVPALVVGLAFSGTVAQGATEEKDFQRLPPVPYHWKNCTWLVHHVSSVWADVLAKGAPQFPGVDSIDASEEWRSFYRNCRWSSMGLFLVGSAICAVTTCDTCGMALPKYRPTSNHIKGKMCWLSLLCVGAVISVLTLGQRGLDLGQEQAHLLIDTLNDAANKGLEAHATSSHISQTLSSGLEDCTMDEHRELLIGKMLGMSVHMTAELDEFNSLMKFVPRLTWAGGVLDDTQEMMLYGASVPLVSILLGCVFLLLTLQIFSCGGRSHLGKCCTCMGKWLVGKVGFAMLMATMLVVVGFTAAALGTALAVGSFCQDADTNMLSAVRHYVGPKFFNITSSYVKGASSNIWFDEFADCNSTLSDMDVVLAELSTMPSCSGKSASTVAVAVASTRNDLADLQHSLHPENMYPMYHLIVHEGVCVFAVSGLGWLIFLQLVAGFISLPILGCMSRRYFEEKEMWSKSVRLMTDNPPQGLSAEERAAGEKAVDDDVNA